MCWHNKDKNKLVCPECGGTCEKIATRYWTTYKPSTEEVQMFADRICSKCANEWTLLERSWKPENEEKKNKREVNR